MANTVKKTPEIIESGDNTHEWESRDLGANERYVKASDQGTDRRLDDGLDLQMISLRLPKKAVEEFKKISQSHGLGYQPFIRQVLMNFLSSQKK
jgi:hypothetical protein